MPRHLLFRRSTCVAKLSKRNAEALVKLVEAFDRAVKIDRIIVAARPKLCDDTLRLAESVSADEYAAAWVRMQAMKQAVDFAACVGVPKDGKSERRLGDEDVARDRHEGRAGRVGPALVISGHNDSLARVLKHDLEWTLVHDAGDLPQDERSVEVNLTLRSFLERTRRWSGEPEQRLAMA